MPVDLLDLDAHSTAVKSEPVGENEKWKVEVKTEELDVADEEDEYLELSPESTPPHSAFASPTPRKPYQRFRDKKFICDVCDRWFTMKQNVQAHLFKYHMGNESRDAVRSKRFPCNQCDQVFRTETQARKHVNRVHRAKRERKEKHECDQCDREYGSAHQLREHVTITHLKLKPFTCDDCGVSFGRSGGLRRHRIMVHTDHKYNCPVVGCAHPGYKCSKALAAHIRSVHTKERPYVCLTCSKTFIRRNDLKMHEETHDPTAAHTCEFCGHDFKRLIYLKKHQRICAKRPGGSRGAKSGTKRSKKRAKDTWSSESDSMDEAELVSDDEQPEPDDVRVAKLRPEITRRWPKSSRTWCLTSRCRWTRMRTSDSNSHVFVSC